MITMSDRSTDRVFDFRVSGRLTRDDYRQFLPRLEAAIEAHGKISVLVDLEALDGIAAGALWEELKFDLNHLRHFVRVAIVGDKVWHERAMNIAKHFTPAEMKYFPAGELNRAWWWVLAHEFAEVTT